MNEDLIKKVVLEAFLTQPDKRLMTSQDIVDECRPIYSLTVDEVTAVMINVGAHLVSEEGNLVWTWNPEEVDISKIKS